MSYNQKFSRNDNGYGFKMGDLNSHDSVFHAIYFIDEISGSLLVSKKNPNASGLLTETKEDLISNFLNAMNMFINEIKKDGEEEEIQEINFKDTRLLYQRKGRILCIGICDKSDVILERAILNSILDDFYDRFEIHINSFKGIIHPAILAYTSELDKVFFNF